MKRVFTQPYAVTADVPNGGDTGSAIIYTAPEDMVLIGFQMSTKMLSTTPIGNDGFADIDFQLSNIGNIAVAYGHSWIHCMAWWNTTPASVGIEASEMVVMFPEGYGITLKEGEVLNLPWSGRNTSAATIRLTCDGTLFLVKGSVKKT